MSTDRTPSSPNTNALIPALPQNTIPYALAIPLSHLPNLVGGEGQSPGALTVAPNRIILEDMVRCILRHWKISALLAGLACGVLLFFMLGRQPEYLAEANVMMRIRDDKVFNFERVVDNSSSEASNIIMLLNNHRVEMQSHRFLEFFLSKLTPEQLASLVAPPAKPTLVSRFMEAVLPAPATAGLTAQEIQRQRFLEICDKAKVDFIKETLILKVAVRHHEAGLAATLANGWAQAYMDYVAHEEGASTRQASVFLREEADQARKRVQASEEKLAAYCREKGLVDDAEQLAGDGEKLKVLSTEQTRREVELAEIVQTLTQVDKAGSEVEKLLAVDGFSKIPTLTTLRSQLTEKLREREILQQRYLPKHPAVLSFEKGYASLKNEINSALQRAIGELRNKQASLTNQVTAIQQQIGSAKGTVAGNGTDNVERKMLRSQLQSDRALYEKLLSRLEEATVSSRFSEVTHLRLAETAEAPRKAVAPNKPLSLVLAGVSFGTLFTIIPLLLGAIGLLRSKGIDGLISQLRSGAPAAPVVAAGLPGLHQMTAGATDLGELPTLSGTDEEYPEAMLYSLFQSDSPEKQFFHRIAENLLNDRSSPGGKAPVVMLTSVRRGEGKSLVASGIGIAAALQNNRVVLIEGNLRRPSVHRYFPRPLAAPSLSDAAREAPHVEWQPEALRFPGSQLFTLEAGDARGLDVEHLFDATWFVQMLNQFRSTCDLVILDAPSLREVPESEQLAMLATRALIIGSVTDQMHTDLPTVASRMMQLVPHLTKVDYLRNHLPA